MDKKIICNNFNQLNKLSIKYAIHSLFPASQVNLFFFAIYHHKLNKLGFLTVGETEQEVLKRPLGSGKFNTT